MNADSVKRRVLRLAHAFPLVRGYGRVALGLSQYLVRSGADPECVVQMRSGFQARLDLRTQDQALAAFTRQYDDDKILLLAHLVREGACVIDAGANIGLYSIPLAMRGLRVLAFEPHPLNICRFRSNCLLNMLDDDNPELFPFGLSSSVGFADMWPIASASNTGVEDWVPAADRHGVSVALKALDAVPIDRPIDLVKIDVEGHDVHLLAGANETLRRHRPIVQCEVSRWFYEQRGENYDALLPPLLPPDYRIYQLPPPARRWSIRDHVWPAVQRSGIGECSGDVFFVPAERSQEFIETVRLLAARSNQ